jgi:hypothetical protein
MHVCSGFCQKKGKGRQNEEKIEKIEKIEKKGKSTKSKRQNRPPEYSNDHPKSLPQ